MKTTNRLSIHFKVRVEREKDGKAPVYLGLTVNGSKCYLALKSLHVDVTHWDISKGCGRSTTKQGRKINEYLDDVRLIIREHCRQLELKVDVSDICYTLFRGKTDHLFAGKEIQQML